MKKLIFAILLIFATSSMAAAGEKTQEQGYAEQVFKMCGAAISKKGNMTVELREKIRDEVDAKLIMAGYAPPAGFQILKNKEVQIGYAANKDAYFWKRRGDGWNWNQYSSPIAQFTLSFSGEWSYIQTTFVHENSPLEGKTISNYLGKKEQINIGGSVMQYVIPCVAKKINDGGNPNVKHFQKAYVLLFEMFANRRTAGIATLVQVCKDPDWAESKPWLTR